VNPDNPDAQPHPLRRYLAYFTLATMPISADIQSLLKQKKLEPVYVSPLDVLLPILGLLMLWDLLKHRPWARFRTPPFSGLPWAFLAVASVLWIPGFPFMDVLKTAAKGPLFFGIAAVWVFQNLSSDLKEYRRLVLILGASFSICTIIALKQYFGPIGQAYDPVHPLDDLHGASNIRVAGWYLFRGIFGAQVALLIPAAVAFAAFDRNVIVRAVAALLALAALCVTLSGGAFLAACAGVAAVGGACVMSRRPVAGAVIFASLLILLGVILPRLPRDNPSVLSRSLALFADDESGDRRPTARMRRYQASLTRLNKPRVLEQPETAPAFLTGVGLGGFQGNVNRTYHPAYPKPMRATDSEADFDMESDEPFTFGLLETTTVELGVGGLLALLFLFSTWITGAFSAFALKSDESEPQSPAAVLALAAFAAGVGAVCLSVFANPAIRGVGGSFAFFLALALVTWRQTHPAAAVDRTME